VTRSPTDRLLPRLRATLDPVDARWRPQAARDADAAVLLLFDQRKPSLPLLFIRRSRRVRSHRGQIAFPGGGAEPGDANPADTALREAEEEVGIERVAVEVVGQLTPVFTASSSRRLVPVVGLVRQPVQPVTDHFEVDEWFWIGSDRLLAAPLTARPVPGAADTLVRFYEAGDRVIWGASAAVLHDLLARLGRAD
jgi:8-oxo-dGTP pyrophosphatase MutT (NUDIX family)